MVNLSGKAGPRPGTAGPVFEDCTSQYPTTQPVFAVSACAFPNPDTVVAFWGCAPLPPSVSKPLQEGGVTKKYG